MDTDGKNNREGVPIQGLEVSHSRRSNSLKHFFQLGCATGQGCSHHVGCQGPAPTGLC